jgi:hypothetical protein
VGTIDLEAPVELRSAHEARFKHDNKPAFQVSGVDVEFGVSPMMWD